MVSSVKKKTKAPSSGVRFSEVDASDRRGILKTDGRRSTKTATENNTGNVDDNKFMSSKTWVMSTVFLLCAIVALSYRGYLDTQAVNYPYQGPKVIQKKSGVEHTLWGTYRPGAYLGLRTKEPLEKGSAAAGLMWYSQHKLMSTGSIDSSVRHMCDNGHENLVYGYVEHNAVNYGHQIINDGKDNGFTLQTIFLRPDKNETESTLNSGLNTDWTTRIIYETNSSESSVSLVWYVYVDPGDDENPLNNQEYSLDVLKNEDNNMGTPLATITGSTPSLSNFVISVIPTTSTSVKNSNKLQINTSISGSWCPNAAMLKHCLARTMVIKRQTLKEPDSRSQVMLMDEKINKPNSEPTSDLLRNFVAVQITIDHNNSKSLGSLHKYSYSLDIAYTQKHRESNVVVFKNTPPSLIGNKFDLVHNEYSTKFNQKFQKTFPISVKENTAENSQWQYFAKVTFSNMAGSVGYFYGSSLVRDDDHVKNVNDDGASKVDMAGAVKYWRAGLLTTVPSRSQFPRGFLWDDGFHGLMIGSWSIELQLNILGHWMDLLNYQGWIPREQILGSEARSRVPEEFVVQGSRNANPPALLLTIDLLLKRIKQLRSKDIAETSDNEKLKLDEIDKTLKRLFPRVKAWYNWFNSTQRSVNIKRSTLSDPDEPHIDRRFVGYRWRGRNALTNRELNPKTLTSGMDDFPRSSHPVNDDGTSNVNVFDTYINKNNFDFYESERHVDLHCWMTHGARILSSYHDYLYPSGNAFDNKYAVHFRMLVESLDNLHWTGKISDLSQKSKMPMYADYGIHTDDVRLEKLKDIDDSVRVVGQRDPPRWRFVDSHVGYNTLFPMFFRLIKNSQRLNAILDLIEGTNDNSSENHGLLTKGCGLRSLSKNSSLYNARNTRHDPPYWRGTVWINMQYLACSSLHYYANLPEETDPSRENNNEFENLEPIRYLDLKTKQRCSQLYDKIRNDVIQCVYKEWKRTGYVWEQYEDEPITDSVFGLIHKGKGTRPFTGWSANVVLLMAEIY